jgi:hypothetical protein
VHHGDAGPGPFGAEHRGVGVAQQVAGVVRVARELRDADRRGHEQLGPVHLEGAAEHVLHPRGDRLRGDLDRVGIGQR